MEKRKKKKCWKEKCRAGECVQCWSQKTEELGGTNHEPCAEEVCTGKGGRSRWFGEGAEKVAAFAPGSKGGGGRREPRLAW